VAVRLEVLIGTVRGDELDDRAHIVGARLEDHLAEHIRTAFQDERPYQGIDKRLSHLHTRKIKYHIAASGQRLLNLQAQRDSRFTSANQATVSMLDQWDLGAH